MKNFLAACEVSRPWQCRDAGALLVRDLRMSLCFRGCPARAALCRAGRLSRSQSGFDVAAQKAIQPDVHYEVMSYCTPRWIAPRSYRAQMATLAAPASSSESASPSAPEQFWQIHQNPLPRRLSLNNEQHRHFRDHGFTSCACGRSRLWEPSLGMDLSPPGSNLRLDKMPILR